MAESRKVALLQPQLTGRAVGEMRRCSNASRSGNSNAPTTIIDSVAVCNSQQLFEVITVRQVIKVTATSVLRNQRWAACAVGPRVNLLAANAAEPSRGRANASRSVSRVIQAGIDGILYIRG